MVVVVVFVVSRRYRAFESNLSLQYITCWLRSFSPCIEMGLKLIWRKKIDLINNFESKYTLVLQLLSSHLFIFAIQQHHNKGINPIESETLVRAIARLIIMHFFFLLPLEFFLYPCWCYFRTQLQKKKWHLYCIRLIFAAPNRIHAVVFVTIFLLLKKLMIRKAGMLIH